MSALKNLSVDLGLCEPLGYILGRDLEGLESDMLNSISQFRSLSSFDHPFEDHWQDAVDASPSMELFITSRDFPQVPNSELSAKHSFMDLIGAQ